MSFLFIQGVLVVSLLLPLVSTAAPGDKIYSCSGELSRLTDTQCDQRGKSSGCYYVEEFQQYRSCAKICNNVTTDSIDADKCKAYCSDYLKEANCMRIVPPTTPDPDIERRRKRRQKVIAGVVGSIGGIIVIALLLFLLYLEMRRCKKCWFCGSNWDCKVCQHLNSTCCISRYKTDFTETTQVEAGPEEVALNPPEPPVEN